MKLKVFLALGLAAMLAGGCVVQSIQPLFADKDILPYPAVLGTWLQKGDDGAEIGTWTFVADGQQYTLTQTDERKHQATFHVAAGKIGGAVFLDGSAADPVPGGQLNDLMALHLVPAHVFAKPIKTNDTLLLLVMDLEWLGDYLKANPSALAHTWHKVDRDNYPLVTASTEDLQKFVAKFANDPKVFKNEIRLVPKNPAR